MDETLEKWLGEFKSENTKRTYYYALRRFKKVLGINDLGAYLKAKPSPIADLRRFLEALDKQKRPSPSKTKSTYAGAVKIFLQEHGHRIPEPEWRKLRRRGFLPKRVRAKTLDKIPTKVGLKRIVNYADIKGRSLPEIGEGQQ